MVSLAVKHHGWAKIIIAQPTLINSYININKYPVFKLEKNNFTTIT